MPLYVMLAKLRESGLARSQENEAGYNEALRGPRRHGEVLDFYAVVGQYDYVIMAHAASIDEAARLSSEIAATMGMKISTLPTVHGDDQTPAVEPPSVSAGVREPLPPLPPDINAAAEASAPESAETEQAVAAANRRSEQ